MLKKLIFSSVLIASLLAIALISKLKKMTIWEALQVDKNEHEKAKVISFAQELPGTIKLSYKDDEESLETTITDFVLIKELYDGLSEIRGYDLGRKVKIEQQIDFELCFASEEKLNFSLVQGDLLLEDRVITLTHTSRLMETLAGIFDRI